MSGRRIVFAGVLLAALAACDSPVTRATGPTGPELPPIGLAATAVWLEDREALNRASAQRALEIRTEQANQRRVGASPQQVAQPGTNLSDAPVPTETVALAARAFADACVASLPTMQNVRAQARAASIRYFNTRPQESSRGLLSGQPTGGDISMTIFEGAGRNRDINQCSVGARRQDASAMAQALVNTLGASGYSLTPIEDDKAQRAWLINGTPEGTILRVNSRRNFLGQTVTGAWITWP